MTGLARPIQIWTPVPDSQPQVWRRPAGGPYGDHHAATRTLTGRGAGASRPRLLLTGESVAAGYLYAPWRTPAHVLAGLLPRWDVLDLARTNESLASLAQTIADGLQLEPDVIVVWAGNNWMLRDLGGLSPLHPASARRRRLGQRLRAEGPAAAATFAASVAQDHVAARLTALHARVTRAGARLVVVIPEVNLLDWPQPQPVSVLPDGAEAGWWQAEAARSASTMLALDCGSNATTHRRLADEHTVRGDTGRALGSLRDGVAAATGPLRATTTSPMITAALQTLLREWARSAPVPTVDVPALIAHAGREGGRAAGRPDRRWFLDYCHHTALGIDLVAGAVADTVDPDHGGQVPDLDPDLAAVAALGALMHTEHRLPDWSGRSALLAHWRAEAFSAAPHAADLAADIVESRLGTAPIPLGPAGRRNVRRPHPFGFAHGWRPHTVEADALAVLGITAEQTQQIVLDAERAWPDDQIWRPGEILWTDEQPGHPTRAFRQVLLPRSHHGVLVRPGQPLAAELTLRRSADSAGGDVEVSLGDWSATLPLTRRWTTHRVVVPPAAAPIGLQPLTLTWPPLAHDRGRWPRVLTDLQADRVPRLHPVFGEVFSVRVARPPAGPPG